MTNKMQIQGLFSSFSSMRDKNNIELYIEGAKWLFPKVIKMTSILSKKFIKKIATKLVNEFY
jgi:hypothetical protein